ncbi:MAG: class I SAM-dependent methyltransferase [Thermoproteota archaeon]|nr:class I SAM-dependent methyltransferase [Thermoproteota archaeon]
MPFIIDDIISAQKELDRFRSIMYTHKGSLDHERFIFPFLCGSYFAYRKIDVERIVSIAKTISKDPSYLDIGCGYGDFLEKIRQYLPNAEGMEKSAEMFFKLGKYKPDYIKIGDAYNDIEKKYDIIFVGWMEPGVDYRDKIAKKTEVIITTLDQGLSLAAEFEGFGYEKVASWITPSWEDINTEITNKYYSKIPDETIKVLSELRGAHNLWYVYSKPKYKESIKQTLAEQDKKEIHVSSRYSHEKVLDECGFSVGELLSSYPPIELWKISFEV